MTDPVVERIRNHPDYQRLKAQRSRLGWTLTILMLIVFYGYIGLIAFDRPFLGRPLHEGAVTSIGMPVALFVILFTIAVTGLYIWRANSRYDALTRRILQEPANEHPSHPSRPPAGSCFPACRALPYLPPQSRLPCPPAPGTALSRRAQRRTTRQVHHTDRQPRYATRRFRYMGGPIRYTTRRIQYMGGHFRYATRRIRYMATQIRYTIGQVGRMGKPAAGRVPHAVCG